MCLCRSLFILLSLYSLVAFTHCLVYHSPLAFRFLSLGRSLFVSLAFGSSLFSLCVILFLCNFYPFVSLSLIHCLSLSLSLFLFLYLFGSLSLSLYSLRVSLSPLASLFLYLCRSIFLSLYSLRGFHSLPRLSIPRLFAFFLCVVLCLSLILLRVCLSSASPFLCFFSRLISLFPWFAC